MVSRDGSSATNYDVLKTGRLSAERESDLKNRFGQVEVCGWYSNRYWIAKLEGDLWD